MNLTDISQAIEEIAVEAGNYIRAEAEGFDPSTTEMKGLNDFVTHVDKGSEELLVAKLGKLIPSAGFLVEENTSSASGDRYTWVVDPLDGTTNFIHGVHPFAMSIALSDRGEIVAGVVYEAAGRETFKTWKGGGAFLNGRRIHVSEISEATKSLIATGFPYTDFTRLSSYLGCLGYMMKNTTGVRRMGSASIDLAYVACGRFDLFFEYGLKPWDVAAGSLLVNEAGGIVSDFLGDRSKVDGKEIVASNAGIYPEMLKIISNFMSK
ncbi:MAG: inositol monophosphatase family protein [Bacteroidales bacterium]|jgi:myo-inositol-1(or 4)-monophosphatase